ncbi:MAG: hypothetical protein WAV11_01885 [Minisyncoccia bacterium]
MTRTAIKVLSRKSFSRNNIFLKYLKENVHKGKGVDSFGLSIGARSVVYDENFRTNLEGEINVCLIDGSEIPDWIKDEEELFSFLSDKGQTGLKEELIPTEVENSFILRIKEQCFWKCKTLLVLHRPVRVKGDIDGNRWLVLHQDREKPTEEEKDFVGSIFPRDFFEKRTQFHLAVGIKS